MLAKSAKSDRFLRPRDHLHQPPLPHPCTSPPLAHSPQISATQHLFLQNHENTNLSPFANSRLSLQHQTEI